MEVISLGWRTELGVLSRLGGVVEHTPTYVRVRTPSAPTSPSANFLLLRRAPTRRGASEWKRRFETMFPTVPAYAFGVDDPAAGRRDLVAFEKEHLEVAVASVLTARTVAPLDVRHDGAEVRRLDDDADWRQRVALALAGEPVGGAAIERAVEARAEAERGLAADGIATWLGAFVDGRLLSRVGLVRVGGGLSRLQEVETHPEARGRGLATTLLHDAATGELAREDVDVLVTVTDRPVPQRAFRRVGFEVTEHLARASAPRR